MTLRRRLSPCFPASSLPACRSRMSKRPRWLLGHSSTTTPASASRQAWKDPNSARSGHACSPHGGDAGAIGAVTPTVHRSCRAAGSQWLSPAYRSMCRPLSASPARKRTSRCPLHRSSIFFLTSVRFGAQRPASRTSKAGALQPDRSTTELAGSFRSAFDSKMLDCVALPSLCKPAHGQKPRLAYPPDCDGIAALSALSFDSSVTSVAVTTKPLPPPLSSSNGRIRRR